ncbi:hypothetical protein [Halobellus rarus]|uniref:GH26 domain-containing protein n=1 Tax=Halobellus rarus TaxID=1126237 RepID=A0ABD6CIC7_9EURY|nr:hypothetical protein [Halobellus rarus]
MKHGLYLLTKSKVEQFEDDWLDGQQIDLVTTTFTAGFHDVVGITWEPGAGASNTRQSLQETFGNTDRNMVIAYEFAGENRGDYGPPARGDFDAKYRSFARDLVSVGMGDAYIAPNHEFSLEWGSKSAYDEPGNYRDGYARVVREMQSVDGADFTFCYAPSQNRIGVADEAWPVQSDYWPSDEPAPIVTPSFYDAGNGVYPDDPSSLTESELEQVRDEAWNQKHKPVLDMWQAFADQRGAKMGFREWGCATEAWTNNGGLDNPEFIHRVLDYAGQHDWVFQTYWNGDSPKHRIYPPEESGLPDVGQAWRDRVLSDLNNTVDSGGSTDSTDTESGTDDTVSAYGGYSRPDEGTLDWHVPLNDNFASIEEDIKDLAERIEQIEST